MSSSTKIYGQKHRDKELKRGLEASASVRDIGDLPEVVNPVRKADSRHNFRLFCENYQGSTYHLKWSDDHLKVIGQIEESVLRGGLFATAMPRGSGKTTLTESACIWAIIYGHRDFVCLIGSDEGRASGMMESIKTELEVNELLLEDFPEVCYPIVKLEGISHRCNGQTYHGDRTHIGWTAKELVLPTILGSPASGAVVKVVGITGGLRGMKYKRPDGRTVRPSLVVIDDPQTDESANSPAQCETRERILSGAILGLAGPGVKISGIMPCTVIRAGDMADNILNRDKHPEWNGTRTKLLYTFPTNTRIWDDYCRIRDDGMRAGDGGRAATAFYAENRAEMDAGADVAWPERREHDELSAIQHAMNLWHRDRRAFFSEYQNEPMPEAESRGDDLTPDSVMARINRIPRGHVPATCDRLTAFIDVQASILYWAVCAWESDFTGYVIDYGTYPDQGKAYYTLKDARYKLDGAIPSSTLEGRVYGGLEAACGLLLAREWPRQDGAGVRVERCLIDANWGMSTPVVYRYCQQSPFGGVLTPSHARYVGAAATPLSDYHKKPGDKVGLNWRMPNVRGRRPIRYVVYDSNYWKSFLHARFSSSMGERGAISVYGDDPERHRLLSDHLTSEYRIATSGRGREVDEWKLRPERPDNHLLDCLSGCAVAASMQGVELPATDTRPKPKAAPVSFADLQRRAMMARRLGGGSRAQI